MDKNSRGLKIFSLLLVFAIQIPILLKAVTDLFLANFLVRINNLSELLPISELGIFNNEFLFKLAIAFSDFNFNTKALFGIVSLLDIMPLLAIILLLEVNRITNKNRHLKRSLLIILFVYFLKYLGLLIIIVTVVSRGFPFYVGFNYLGYWLIFIGLVFFLSIGYLIYAYNSFYTFKDYISCKL